MDSWKIRCFNEHDVDKAKNGDIETAKFLARCASDCLVNDTQMPDSLRDYISECLSNVASGQDPIEALNIKQKPGPKPANNRNRDLKMAMAVRKLILEGYTLKGNNSSDGAFDIVGKRFHKSRNTVAKIYKRWRKPIEETEDGLIALGISPSDFDQYMG